MYMAIPSTIQKLALPADVAGHRPRLVEQLVGGLVVQRAVVAVLAGEEIRPARLVDVHAD